MVDKFIVHNNTLIKLSQIQRGEKIRIINNTQVEKEPIGILNSVNRYIDGQSRDNFIKWLIHFYEDIFEQFDTLHYNQKTILKNSLRQSKKGLQILYITYSDSEHVKSYLENLLSSIQLFLEEENKKRKEKGKQDDN